ncbi:MAG: pantetheine-phosphate adenylyltransferase [Bdellovibrionaceae bacterium]|nr:pantetheine-phosphate adenylyltransferase [Bdellovibrionales bacterium]MCB9084832.1 pantetheine-phosphate adenylyltransferase [Pseudobdellovibrionaceae bacterium]
MVRAVYPGSFDPITYGHLDIIKRIQPLFSEVVVLVAQSEQKSYMFAAEERAELIRQCLSGTSGVKVEVFSGLTVDYAKRSGAQVIVRGLRAVSDYEYELAMANMNRKLAPEIETMIVFTRPEYNYVSSRMVKEVAVNGGSLQDLVPGQVADALKKRI